MKNNSKAPCIVVLSCLLCLLAGFCIAIVERQKRLDKISLELDEMMEDMRESARERLRWRAKLKAEAKAHDDAVAADREKFKAQDKEFEDARKAYRDAVAADRRRD